MDDDIFNKYVKIYFDYLFTSREQNLTNKLFILCLPGLLEEEANTEKISEIERSIIDSVNTVNTSKKTLEKILNAIRSSDSDEQFLSFARSYLL